MSCIVRPSIARAASRTTSSRCSCTTWSASTLSPLQVGSLPLSAAPAWSDAKFNQASMVRPRLCSAVVARSNAGLKSGEHATIFVTLFTASPPTKAHRRIVCTGRPTNACSTKFTSACTDRYIW